MGGPTRGTGPRDGGTSAGADFLTAAALIAVFVVAAYFSVQMERPRGWLSAPGLLPLLLSGMLIVMFSVIAGRAVRRGALEEIGRITRPHSLGGWFREERRRRVILAAGVIALYYFGLLGFLPFEAATVLFFLIIFSIFWAGASWARRLVVSIGLTVAFAAGFRGFFRIILPGQGDLLGAFLFWLNG